MSAKISSLPIVISANIVDTDILPIVVGVATNTAITKRVSISELRLKLGTNAPGEGRTVTNTATYLFNNAEYNVRDFGAFGDGVTNDLAAFNLANAAITAAGGGTIRVPRSTLPYILSPWFMVSNTRLILEPGVVIKAATGYAVSDRILNVLDISSVTIWGYGATLTQAGLYTTGEQRHNLFIGGSTNINVHGLGSKLAAGDGFYIGAGLVATWSTNVLLEDCISSFNRRQGLSITSCVNCNIRGGRYTDTGADITVGGTAPFSGIDVEPNGAANRIEGVSIVDVYTENNVQGYGIITAPGTFANTGNRFEVEIRNHLSNNDLAGFLVGALNAGAAPPIGYIRYEGKIYNAVNMGVLVRNYDYLGPRVTLEVVIHDPNSFGQTSPKYGSGIVVYREPTDTGATSIGNVEIKNADIYDSRATAKMVRALYVRDETASPSVLNVDLLNPVRMDWADASISKNTRIWFAATGTVQDGKRVLGYTVNSSFTMAQSGYFRTFDNSSWSAGRNITLATAYPVGGPDVTFKLTQALGLTLICEGSEIILPEGGPRLISSAQGASVTLRRVAAGEWHVVDRVGPWTPSGFSTEIDPISLTGTLVETDLTNQSIQGGQFRFGQIIRVKASGTATGTAGTKTIRLKIGGVTLVTISELAAEQDDWSIDAWIYYSSAAAQRISLITYQANTIEVHDYLAGGCNTAADFTIQITGQLGNVGDTIIQRTSDEWLEHRALSR